MVQILTSIFANAHALTLIAVGATIVTAGDLSMRYWTVNNSNYSFIIGVCLYLIGMIFLANSYRKEEIAIASIIFVAINITTLLVASWYLFKDPVSLRQLIGIIVAAIAIFIIES